ncbi:MAG: hypothetical protein ACE5NP_11145 [Anaerolineae bacterium]
MRSLFLCIAVATLLIAAGCAGPQPTVTPSPTAIGPPAQPTPTSTLEPTATPEPTAPPTTPGPTPVPAEAVFLGYMPAFHAPELAVTLGGRWDRPFFEAFGWNTIEPEPGSFDWGFTDHMVEQSQAHGLHIVANIQPFADWDQETCHTDLLPLEVPGGKEGEPPPGGKEKGALPPPPQPPARKGAPCDWQAYADFVRALVERYDGDGLDDMPDLTIPIKHWEVANEPSLQEPPLVFFQGPPQDYAALLQATYAAVKEADPEALVLHGGMAGMAPSMADYWRQVLAVTGSEPFDLVNIHSIDHGEHVNLPALEELLAQFSLEKPVWVTELQIGPLTVPGGTEDDFAAALARSVVYALGHGVERLFYVQLVMEPGMPPPEEGGPGFVPQASLGTLDGKVLPAGTAYALLLEKLAGYTAVETLVERVEGRRVTEGQYRFTVGDRPVYVLWGEGPPPAELRGTVIVTDLKGEARQMEAEALTLSPAPVFVEPAGRETTLLPPQASPSPAPLVPTVPGVALSPVPLTGEHRIQCIQFAGPTPTGPGPHRHVIYSAVSTDGLTWEKEGVLVARGSVPEVVILPDGNFLLIKMMGCLFAYSNDGLSFQEVEASVSGTTGLSPTGEPGDLGVDPSAILLPDGRVRAYFYEPQHTPGQDMDPAAIPGPHPITSYTSDDGFNWVRDEGYRIELEKVTDPDIVMLDDQFFLYLSEGSKVRISVSSDGLKFTALDGYAVTDGGIPDTIAMDGGLRMYYHSPDKRILSAFSADGLNWQPEGVRLEPGPVGSFDANGVESPSVVRLPDGRYRMYYVTSEQP